MIDECARKMKKIQFDLLALNLGIIISDIILLQIIGVFCHLKSFKPPSYFYKMKYTTGKHISLLKALSKCAPIANWPNCPTALKVTSFTSISFRPDHINNSEEAGLFGIYAPPLFTFGHLIIGEIICNPCHRCSWLATSSVEIVVTMLKYNCQENK